jgi:hypothetical protein
MPSVSLPTLMTGASAAMTAAGGGISALSTIAGGNAQAQIGQAKQTAANFQADQLTSNAAGAIAGASRQSIDIQQKANALRSTSQANAAAGGVVTTSGSAVTNEASIASRGRNEATLAMFNGQNRAVGLLNEAAGARYEGTLEEETGQYEKQASMLSAAGTIAGAGGSIFKLYGTQGSPN